MGTLGDVKDLAILGVLGAGAYLIYRAFTRPATVIPGVPDVFTMPVPLLRVGSSLQKAIASILIPSTDVYTPINPYTPIGGFMEYDFGIGGAEAR